MKNESGLHFLGWMILSHASENKWISLMCVVIAIGYSILSLIELWKDRP